MVKRLIAGPPCAGKTTYVKQYAAAGDRVLDFDDIVEDLTGERYGQRTPEVIEIARRLWVEALPESDWVIWTAPRRSDRGRFRSQHNAEVFVILPPREVCLERASDRPAIWQQLIHQWYAQWEPSRSGAETIIHQS